MMEEIFTTQDVATVHCADVTDCGCLNTCGTIHSHKIYDRESFVSLANNLSGDERRNIGLKILRLDICVHCENVTIKMLEDTALERMMRLYEERA